ncbi:MAG TPA: hypothetical protein VGS19_29170 [Streptosporangiaceae bacterium]|nr:hypothetical protein [Streptosporangiaceae bacterium]
MPATSPVYAGARVTAAVLAAAVGVTAWKASPTSLTSNTTLTADPDLVVPLAANATYQVQMVLSNCAGGGSGALKYNFAVPAGASGDYTVVQNSTGGTVGIFDAGGWASVLASNCNAGVMLNGFLFTAAAAGSLQFMWAQNSSSGTATTVGMGSFLWVRRVA